MTTKIHIKKTGKAFYIHETRAGKVPNHRYNTRRSALLARIAYIKAIMAGEFEFVGLTEKENEIVNKTFLQWKPWTT